MGVIVDVKRPLYLRGFVVTALRDEKLARARVGQGALILFAALHVCRKLRSATHSNGSGSR